MTLSLQFQYLAWLNVLPYYIYAQTAAILAIIQFAVHPHIQFDRICLRVFVVFNDTWSRQRTSGIIHIYVQINLMQELFIIIITITITIIIVTIILIITSIIVKSILSPRNLPGIETKCTTVRTTDSKFYNNEPVCSDMKYNTAWR